jgi:hypothetical protein
MYLENNYIHFSSKLIINSIPNYKNIMTKFINRFIKLYKSKYTNNHTLVVDSIIYSKYYLYYKTKNCIYDDEIMDIINNIDFSFTNDKLIN